MAAESTQTANSEFTNPNLEILYSEAQIETRIKELSNSIRGKDVLVVEDIIDTGLTLSRLLDILGSRGANSIKLTSFLDKPAPRIKTELKIDYTGFVVPNKF